MANFIARCAAIAALVVLAGTGHISGQAAAQTVNVDANKAADQASNFLQNIGIQPSGSIKEAYGYWCIFNNWQDRDSFARAHGTFDNRFSTGTMFGGKWYCASEKAG